MTLVPPFCPLWLGPNEITYRQCSVPRCKTNTNNSPTKNFFIPRSRDFKKLWLQQVGLDFEPYKNANVFFCEDHFEDEEDSYSKSSNENQDVKETSLSKLVCYQLPTFNHLLELQSMANQESTTECDQEEILGYCITITSSEDSAVNKASTPILTSGFTNASSKLQRIAPFPKTLRRHLKKTKYLSLIPGTAAPQVPKVFEIPAPQSVNCEGDGEHGHISTTEENGTLVLMPKTAPEVPKVLEISPRQNVNYEGDGHISTKENVTLVLMPKTAPEVPKVLEISPRQSVNYESDGHISTTEEDVTLVPMPKTAPEVPKVLEISSLQTDRYESNGHTGTRKKIGTKFTDVAVSNVNHDHKYDYLQPKRKMSLATRVSRVDDSNYAILDHDYAINSIQLVVKQKNKPKMLSPNNCKQCYCCNIVFQRKFNFYQHLQEKHGYSYEDQKIEKSQDNHVDKGSIENVTTSEFKCHRCNIVVQGIIYFFQHLKEKHNYSNKEQKNYEPKKCPVVKKKLPTSKFQDNHVDKDGEENLMATRFKCHHCSIEIFGINNFTRHLQEIHDYSDKEQKVDGSKKCPVVEKNSPTSKFQDNHVDKVGDENLTTARFKCQHCSIEFQGINNFTRHLQEIHDYSYKEQNIDESKKCLVGEENSATPPFQENYSDKIADENVTTTPAFKCHNCNIIFKGIFNFYQHLKEKHEYSYKDQNIEESKKCSVGKENFPTPTFQDNHVDKIADENVTTPASICNSSKYQRQIDLYYDLQERQMNCDRTEYKCKACELICYSRSDFLKHIYDEHVDNEETDSADSITEYNCRYCGLEFNQLGSVWRHISIKHPKKYAEHMKNKKLENSGDSKHKKLENSRVRKINNKLRKYKVNNLTLKCGHCHREYLKKGFLLKHLQNHHGFDSAFALKCNYCDKECCDKAELFKHMKKHSQKESYVEEKTAPIQDELVDLQKQPVNEPQEVNFQIDYDTEVQPLSIQKQPIFLPNTFFNTQEQSENTHDECLYTQEDCEYTQDDWEYPGDECEDTDDEILDIPDEPLDIKPEIFQCTQCPSSFLCETEMMSHLQIIHGNIIDRCMEKIKSNKRVEKPNPDTSNTNEHDKEQNVCENIYAGSNFAELETNIKKEFNNALTDVDLTDEQQIPLSLMSDVDPEFLEKQYNINECGPYGFDTKLAKDYCPQEKINTENTNMNWEGITIKVEHLENDDNQCSVDSYDTVSYPNIEAIKCKCCQITFSNQEELLDHIHKLMNKKVKLYAGAIQVFKPKCVQVTKPQIVLQEEHSEVISNTADAKQALTSEQSSIKCGKKRTKIVSNKADTKKVLKSKEPKTMNYIYNQNNDDIESIPLLNRVSNSKHTGYKNKKNKMRKQNSVESKEYENMIKNRTNDNIDPKFMLKSKSVQLKEVKIILNRIDAVEKKNQPQQTNVNLHVVGGNFTEDKEKIGPAFPFDKDCICKRCGKQFTLTSRATYRNKNLCAECRALEKRKNKRNKRKKHICICKRCGKGFTHTLIGTYKNNNLCAKCQILERKEYNRNYHKRLQLIKQTTSNKYTHRNERDEPDKPKPLTLDDERILKNMHRFFRKTLQKKSFPSKITDKELAVKKIEPKEDTIQKSFNIEDNELFSPETLLFEANDLLKPIREEDEKILVQAYDPKLCKSCLKPLNDQESTSNDRFINNVCDKCKVFENCNEMRKKSDEEMKKSDEEMRKSDEDKGKYNDNTGNNKLNCQMCSCVFYDKLDLRRHAVGSHL